ncbi:MAG: hypothetical protein HeimC2_33690 [Candidatus Heimdallarchaeota archaeon LC_2]|nr:MAG: hypothetical protein HeimC2_33690 [Candidatus Heimdallarchaeota archaeon LC_2]
MTEEFDPSSVPLPEGVLPDVQQLLGKIINKDREEAIEYLQKDPIAVVALSKILKDIQKNPTEAGTAFREIYDSKVMNLFNVDHLVDEEGLAFTAELLLGYWRKINQQIHIESFNELILENLELLKLQAITLDPSPGNRVIFEIIQDGITRIDGMQTHEKTKATKNMDTLSLILDEFVEKQFKPISTSGIPDVWHSLLALATMKQATAREFRKLMSNILLRHFKSHFDKFQEDQKFVIAPYLTLLEKIIHDNDP